MAKINLQKGERIDLTKNDSSLKKLVVEMGWSASGFGSSIDLDTSVFMVEKDVIKDIVSFSNLNSKDRSIHHHGDDLTGGGRADNPNEIIDVVLDKVSPNIDKLVFIMNIFSCKSRNQTFGNLKNAWIRLRNADTNEVYAQFTLSGDSEINDKTALYIGEVYRNNSDWKFNSTGLATYDESIGSMKSNWGKPVVHRERTTNQQSDGLMGKIKRFFG